MYHFVTQTRPPHDRYTCCDKRRSPSPSERFNLGTTLLLHSHIASSRHSWQSTEPQTAGVSQFLHFSIVVPPDNELNTS